MVLAKGPKLLLILRWVYSLKPFARTLFGLCNLQASVHTLLFTCPNRLPQASLCWTGYCPCVIQSWKRTPSLLALDSKFHSTGFSTEYVSSTHHKFQIKCSNELPLYNQYEIMPELICKFVSSNLREWISRENRTHLNTCLRVGLDRIYAVHLKPLNNLVLRWFFFFFFSLFFFIFFLSLVNSNLFRIFAFSFLFRPRYARESPSVSPFHCAPPSYPDGYQDSSFLGVPRPLMG